MGAAGRLQFGQKSWLGAKACPHPLQYMAASYARRVRQPIRGSFAAGSNACHCGAGACASFCIRAEMMKIEFARRIGRTPVRKTKAPDTRAFRGSRAQSAKAA